MLIHTFTDAIANVSMTVKYSNPSVKPRKADAKLTNASVANDTTLLGNIGAIHCYFTKLIKESPVSIKGSGT